MSSGQIIAAVSITKHGTSEYCILPKEPLRPTIIAGDKVFAEEWVSIMPLDPYTGTTDTVCKYAETADN